MKRKTKPPIDDYPMPWEHRPVTLARWRKHHENIVQQEQSAGHRPVEWWCYERKLLPPSINESETQKLYAMGELSAEEIAELMPEWREAYDHAIEVVTVGSLTHTMDAEARRKYLNWRGVPDEIVCRFDAEAKAK